MDRAIHVLRVFAEDRNRKRTAVFNKDLAVAIEQHAPRSPQCERALMVVRGQFLEPRMLDDLEEPEPQGQRREHHDHGVLQDSQPKRNAATIFVH